MSQAQASLFPDTEDTPPGVWKTHRPANAAPVSYRCEGERLILWACGEMEGRASWHPSQGGKWIARVEGQKIHIRDKLRGSKRKELLTRIAMAVSDVEKAQQIHKLASELEVSARKRAKLEAECKPRKRNTLCSAPEPSDYDLRPIVPVRLIGQLNEVCSGPTFAPQFLWLEEREEPTPGEKRVYARLSLFAGYSGVARASQRTIAGAVGMSLLQVQNILDSLRNRHLIREVARGARGVVHYQFLWHPWIDGWIAAHPSDQLTWSEVTNGDMTTDQESWPKKKPEKTFKRENNNNNAGGGAAVADEVERLEKELAGRWDIPNQRKRWEKKSDRRGWTKSLERWLGWLRQLAKETPAASTSVGGSPTDAPEPPWFADWYERQNYRETDGTPKPRLSWENVPNWMKREAEQDHRRTAQNSRRPEKG